MTNDPLREKLEGLTRPIIGIENRTALEVFDIMSDRINRSDLLPAARAGAGEVVVPLASLKMCRDVAMEHTAYAHIPECGKLSLIAQELDACLAAVLDTQPSPPAAEQGEGPYSYEALKLGHEMSHEAATSMGYPSVTEALEHLSELRSTPPAADAAMVEAQQTIHDALMDSQYLAGVGAGWNAAQADDPEVAFAALRKSREGHLAGYAEAKAILASRQPAGVRCGYCDGTGDVHRADGEWLGKCVCAAAPATDAGEK
ncbi:hypothetical protein PX554_18015 [Sphingomonas sp. H39-1-10]|uniref:hypothetical protein n=1 Tax=Sphingomonas pollutisoli TaxID=3030829 RepID=UPI0023B9D2D2|nr:hypothetical protein [Sphingomonas pollutisoli]MDF0490035.1 hypothetical protein [Sphingomonas pollutisoli]